MSLKSNPLSEKQISALNELVKEISAEQIIWLNGFLEGKLSGLNGKAPELNGKTVIESTPVAQKSSVSLANLTILYGTETGKSKELAEKLADKAAFRNISASIFNMYDYDTKKLAQEENLAIIVSTHGEGDPPDMAEDFYKYVTGKRVPKLPGLNYSVLALGDKSYKFFCKAGEDIDTAIKKTGAKTITPIVKCDLDYEVKAEIWMNNLLLNLTPATQEAAEETLTEEKVAVEYSKKNPFQATVLEKVRITGNGSDKEVYHLELSLEGSGLSYEPGDSLGIFTRNPEELIDAIVKHLGANPSQRVFLPELIENDEEEEEQKVTFYDALTYHREITVITYDFLQNYYEKTKNQELQKLLSDEKLLDEYLYGHDLLDVLEDFPFEWNVIKLVEILRPMPARLYSISSSQDKVGDEVHVTVSVVRFERRNRLRHGACSSNLSDYIDEDDTIPVYIEKNPGFKLPLNGSKIIMVGAGTGVAPYRAFMQHRESKGIQGNSWLVFGDRRFHTDFLYQTEWQKLLASKSLERMDVAFSRDQEEKVYVQHKLLENQQEIFKWLEEGAYFYLCGDKKNMAKDVNKTLLEIIRAQGGISEEKASEYIKKLKRERRFQSDVY